MDTQKYGKIRDVCEQHHITDPRPLPPQPGVAPIKNCPANGHLKTQPWGVRVTSPSSPTQLRIQGSRKTLLSKAPLTQRDFTPHGQTLCHQACPSSLIQIICTLLNHARSGFPYHMQNYVILHLQNVELHYQFKQRLNRRDAPLIRSFGHLIVCVEENIAPGQPAFQTRSH
jgi:hypothetical protein